MKIFTLFVAFTLACLALSPRAQALLPPPAPDGGYPGANTAEGTDALFSLTSGIANTAVGLNALHDNTTGTHNVAVGASALASNTTGSFNMAIGTDALRDNNSNFNLAIGFRVLFMNTTGNHLTGIGAAALRNNTTAGFNTAIGADALRENTTGEDNTAIGADALAQNIHGGSNTAVVSNALTANTSANSNTAIGASALPDNISGIENTAVGSAALFTNVDGSHNIAVGQAALSNNTSGSNNIAVGEFAGLAVTTSNNVISIGVQGQDISDSCFIGNIFNAMAPSGSAVFIDANNRLGTITSSKRFKESIEPMDKASDGLFALKPVRFHYKKEIDPAGTKQLGLVAEDVEKVNPDLVVRDKEGKPYSVRYDQVNAMLLNEFIKEHKAFIEEQRKVEVQEKTIAQLKSGMTALAPTVKQQASQIQKVSTQLEASKPAPQVVNNP